MTVNDIIVEISAAQAKKLRKERNREEFLTRQQDQLEQEKRNQAAEQARQELARRKLAAKLKVPEAPPPVETTPVDNSSVLAQFYAQQLAKEREEIADDIIPLNFKFQTVVNRKNRTKQLYGFWTRELIQRLEDVMRTRQYIFLDNFQGTSKDIVPLFTLIKNLGKEYGLVRVFFDKQNIREFPGLAEVYKRMNDAYQVTKRSKEPFGYEIDPDTKKLRRYIAWQLVDRPPETYKIKSM
jgi:hypothetical protein